MLPDDVSPNLSDRLSAHKIAASIPRDEIEWLAAHATFRHLEPGQILTSRAAGVVEGLFFVLSGHVALHVDRANGREKIMDWRAGDVAGMLPYSRLTVPPGDSIALEPSDIAVIHRQDLPALIRECHGLTTALVHVMVDRARHFTSSDLHADKMASLGKLSAGLAHELNNPASAIARSARALHQAMTACEDASRALGALPLNDAQRSAIDQVRNQCLQTAVHVVRSPLQQTDREDEFAAWLEVHGADSSDAVSLAETALELPLLESLTATLSGAELTTVLRWFAAGCLTRHLAQEIEEASTRISSLVDAVKGFTRMDLNATAGPVDIAEGLTQTLAILKGKARSKAVAIRMDIPPDLPRAQGVAGELNQVWVNLLDNALDAAGTSGNIHISAAREGPSVAVHITDSGPGIPAEIRNRIFDPFFTTKKVGQGTGLGLDIVKRIITKHGGGIALDSEPGRTCFTVALPIAAQPTV